MRVGGTLGEDERVLGVEGGGTGCVTKGNVIMKL